MTEAVPPPTPEEGKDGATERREGRGRLSSIDMLPEECEPDIVWALEQLDARQKPANMILAEFNARLADRGVAGISKSAWGRWAISKAIKLRKRRQISDIAEVIARERGTDKTDEITILLAEMTKMALFDLLEGRTTFGDLKSASITLSGLESALGKSSERRRRLQAERDKAAKAIEAIGKEQGADPALMSKITAFLSTGAL